MGLFSSKPVPEPKTYKLRSGALNAEQFLYIADNYMLASRLFNYETSDLARVDSKNPECYGSYLVECGKNSLKILKKRFGISKIEACIASDYSKVRYRIDASKAAKTLAFTPEQQKTLKRINARLQPYNGHASDAPCNRHEVITSRGNTTRARVL